MSTTSHRYLDGFSTPKQATLIGPLFRTDRAGPVFREAPLIFVDGGAAFRQSVEGENHRGWLVGDGDSFDGCLDQWLPTAKDYSDLAFAFGVLPDSVKLVQLNGFLGGRRDHEWVGIGEAAHWVGNCLENQVGNQAEKGLEIGVVRVEQGRAAVFDRDVYVLGRGSYHWNFSGTFTVVSYRDIFATMGGAVRYPLDGKAPLPGHSSLGLSNEAHGKWSLEISDTAVVFVSPEN